MYSSIVFWIIRCFSFAILERRRAKILEKLVKALFEWLASLWYEMVEYLLDQLMELFHVDLSYFAERVPVIDDIANIFVAVGWALLIGNLAYQAMRSMVSGVGIEAEEPGRLFLRTAMFSFLLLVSRQICDIGFGLSATVMEMLQVPDAITFEPFGEETFDTLPNAGWLIVIIVNVVIQWQLIRLFFEVAERYVILCVLTYCAPLAFAMGGSKSTGDIFRGWLRMFASMCVLMVFNLMFVKLVLSALSTDPNGAAIIPWAMLVVGIVRMAKKMDGIILRIGMNPALTGDPLGTRFPGALTAMTLRSIAQIVTRTAAQGVPSAGHGSSTPPASGYFMQHGGKQGGQSIGTAGVSAQGGAAAGAAGVAGAAIHAAGSGARAMNDLALFRNRHGAGDPASMRQVSQAISVDADDWEDGSSVSNSVSSIRSQNQSVSEANAVSRMMVSPVSPAIPPLPADFGRMGAPQTESTLRAPVMPTHRTDTAPGLSVTPVPHATVMPRAHGQVVPDGITAPSAPPEATAETRGTRPSAQPAASRPARVTPVSSVSPPHVQTLLHSESNLSEVRAGYTEQSAPERPPVSPAESAGHSSSIVPTAAVAAATIAKGHTAPVVPPNQTAPAGSTVSPPSRTLPPAPPVQQAVRQTGAISGTDGSSIRVTPVVPQTTGAAVSGQPTPRTGVQPVSHTTVQPPSSAMRTQALTAPAISPASADGGRRPVVSPATPAPDRRTAVSPSRREHSEIPQTTTVQSNASPIVRTPDMVGRPQIADKTRRLRRSAQPLNNKETPQEGGKHHKRRKKK